MKSLILLFLTSSFLILSSCKEDPMNTAPASCLLTKETEQYSDTRFRSIDYEYEDQRLSRVIATYQDSESSFSFTAQVSYDEQGRISRLEVDENHYSTLTYRGDTIFAYSAHPFWKNESRSYLRDEHGNIIPLDGNEYIFNAQGQLTDIIYEEPEGFIDPESSASVHYEYDDQINPFYGKPSIAAVFLNTISGEPVKLMFFSFDLQSIQGPNNVKDFNFVLRTGNEVGDVWNYEYNDLGYPIEAKIHHSLLYDYQCF